MRVSLASVRISHTAIDVPKAQGCVSSALTSSNESTLVTRLNAERVSAPLQHFIIDDGHPSSATYRYRVDNGGSSYIHPSSHATGEHLLVDIFYCRGCTARCLCLRDEAATVSSSLLRLTALTQPRRRPPLLYIARGDSVGRNRASDADVHGKLHPPFESWWICFTAHGRASSLPRSLAPLYHGTGPHTNTR